MSNLQPDPIPSLVGSFSEPFGAYSQDFLGQLQKLFQHLPYEELIADSKNTYTNSKYLRLGDLLEAIRPALFECGFAVTSEILFDREARLFVVKTTLLSLLAHGSTSSSFPIVKMEPFLSIGSVVTYGTRYNLYAILGISPLSDDNDGAPPEHNYQASAGENPLSFLGLSCGGSAPYGAPVPPTDQGGNPFAPLAAPVQPRQVLG